MLSIEILIIAIVGFLLCWRMDLLIKRTVFISGMILVGASLLLASMGLVDVQPIRPPDMTAIDLIIPVLAGLVLALAIRVFSQMPAFRRPIPDPAFTARGPDPVKPTAFETTVPAVTQLTDTQAPPRSGGLG